jgi:hypothetical protein
MVDFTEAVNHCRWKKVLNETINNKINISHYENKDFDTIYIDVSKIIKPIFNLGPLTTYDITVAICRYYNVNIDYIYIIGNGPKKAIKILNIKTKKKSINHDIKLQYVEIKDVINAFHKNGFTLNENIKNNSDSDIWESFLCNWSKKK